MRVYFRDDRKWKGHHWSREMKYRTLWMILFLFIIFSVYFLLPENRTDHDRGTTSSELTKIEKTEGNIIRVSYVDTSGKLTYAIDKRYAIFVQTKDEEGRVLEEHYLDENEEPTACWGYFGISYEHREGEDIITYGIQYVGDISLYLNRNGKIKWCVDNLLTGYPFMVVAAGVLLCILLCLLPRKLQKVILLAYIIFIFYETLMFRETGDNRANLVLFSYADTFLTDWKIRVDVVNNVWLFIPFGTGLYAIFRKKRVWIAALALSVTIELIQYFTGWGIAELDDLFGNTLGGVIGVWGGVAMGYVQMAKYVERKNG